MDEHAVDLDLLANSVNQAKFSLVIVESPYAGDVEENLIYARLCCRDSYMRGENPFASHLFYTQFMDDKLKEEREAGILLGFEHWERASKIVFYIDKGLSNGMRSALDRAIDHQMRVEMRYLHEGPLYAQDKHFRTLPKSPIHGELPNIQRP